MIVCACFSARYFGECWSHDSPFCVNITLVCVFGSVWLKMDAFEVQFLNEQKWQIFIPVMDICLLTTYEHYKSVFGLNTNTDSENKHKHMFLHISGGSRISRRRERGPRRGGGMDSRGSYISKMLYVKTKESGPLGGRAAGTPPLDPPMHIITYPSPLLIRLLLLPLSNHYLIKLITMQYSGLIYWFIWLVKSIGGSQWLLYPDSWHLYRCGYCVIILLYIVIFFVCVCII